MFLRLDFKHLMCFARYGSGQRLGGIEDVGGALIALHVQHAAFQQAEIYVDSDKAHAQLML